jgi:hypothetical protein
MPQTTLDSLLVSRHLHSYTDLTGFNAEQPVLSLVAYIFAIGITLWMDDVKGIATIREEEVKKLEEERELEQ